MPPPLSSSDTAASVCSVDGYIAPDDSGITDPSCSLPAGAALVGGASSTCSDPSRLVWPTVAVALAGRSTSPLMLMVSRARQPLRSILVTLPTVTSPTRTREFCSMLSTSGSCAWIVYEPGPPPSVPGSGTEFRPRQPHLDSPAAANTTSSPTAMRRKQIRIMIQFRAAPLIRAVRPPDSWFPPQRAAAACRPAPVSWLAVAGGGECSLGASNPRCK